MIIAHNRGRRVGLWCPAQLRGRPAIWHATGIRVRELPITVEKLGLTRFGGHPEAFARGATDAKNTPTVFT